MFDQFLALRLSILDNCNDIADGEQDATARAWADILELEAARLTENPAAWLPVSAGLATALRRRRGQQWGRMLGHVDARLSLIVADQVVAALIRGHLGEPVA